MSKDEALVLGHHENDQFETFLYRLFRGSSPRGLSVIKEISIRNNKVLCRPFLQVSKNIIIDVFLGSGSTLITCEKTNRKCYGMEIDPHYCDVIVKRWEEFSGKKAERVERAEC